MLKDKIHISRRAGLRTLGAMSAAAFVGSAEPVSGAPGETKDAYPPEVVGYLKRLYDRNSERFAFRDDYPGGFASWHREARAELLRRVGLDRIAESARGHRPAVELGETADLGEFTRQHCMIETEPEVRLPFWLLKPKGKGPWPLGIFPHGHAETGHNTTAGVFGSEAAKKRALAEDRDVAVQAAKAGMVAIAPAVRGLSWVVPDLNSRVGKDCRSHAVQCLLAGRTAMGERVWDMVQLLDWASRMPDVSTRHVLSMGNSGGGMVTIFLAACDPRVTIAVPSCSFAPTVTRTGFALHCPCNTVPGVMDLGGMQFVAGLIAPRYLLAVNGRKDKLFPAEEIESAASTVRQIYLAAGHGDHFEHLWGPEGHRFYKDLMWPFVKSALSSPAV